MQKPLMMAYEGFESPPDNFGKFIHQFQPETKTLIWKLERILIKLYRQNVSLLFYIFIYISSSSYRAGSTDIPDPLSPLLPIVHRPR